MMSLAELAPVVKTIARDAGAIALDHFRSIADLPVEQKGHLDLVTAADREVEAFLVSRLNNAFPDDGIFGEEGGGVAGHSGRIWVIDPIDGTFNFVRGGQDWAVSIGLYANDRPIFGVLYAPARDLLLIGGDGVPSSLNGSELPQNAGYNASRACVGIGLHPTIKTEDRLEVLRFISDDLRINFRCCGSSVLALIAIAMGETDGYVALGDSTWDVMAGLPILENLGVTSTITWDGVGLDAKLRFACGSKDLLKKLRPLLLQVGHGEAVARAINA